MSLDKKYIYGSVLLATSVFSYMGCKGKLTAMKDLIIGRRDGHNVMPDIVDDAKPSVVIVEVMNESTGNGIIGRPMTVLKASGFIVKEDGLIMTNAHALLNIQHTSVMVRIMDEAYVGHVEDLDMITDLATIRVPVKNLCPLKLGSSSKTRLGEWVIAMGCPLSLANTVTAGIVSCANRTSKELGIQGRDNMEYIQTDAMVVFGNSGGPLINMNGEVIGINTFRTGWGATFAIPIDYAKDFLEKCASNSGHYVYKTLGVSMILLTKNLRPQVKMNNPDTELPDDIDYGVIIWKVAQGSPAQVGGLRSGDIVIGANGTCVRSSKDIYSAVDECNGTLTLQVVRGFHRISVVVTPDMS